MGVFIFPPLYGTGKKEEKEMGKTWQRISDERGIPLNDQYFMVYCETKEKMYEFRKKLYEEYDFIFIDAYSGGLPTGPWIYANLNSKFMFYGNIGVNLLSGPVVGDHALTMEEFIQIADIYRKYKGYSLLVFSEEGQRKKEESDRKAMQRKIPEYYDAKSVTIDEYKENIRKCLLDRCNEREAEQLMKLYEEDIDSFLNEKNWTPGTAAFAMMMGY